MRSKYSILAFAGLFLLAVGLLTWAIRLELTTYAVVPLALGGIAVLVYVGMNVSFLTEKVTKRSAVAGANMAVSIIIFLAIVVFLELILSKHSKKFDFTESKKFTLATQTVHILEGLSEPIKMLYLENHASPQTNERTKELLELYQGRTKQLSYEVVDPDKEPEKVQELAPVTLGAVYILKGAQKEKVSPVDENTLTNGLMKLVKGRNRVVYFTTGHDEHSIDSKETDGLMGMKQVLEEEGYLAKNLQLFTMEKAPEDAVALVIAGPKKPFLETEVQALATYLKQGGKLFAMLDPEYEIGVEKLLNESYGVELGNDWVLENNPLVKLFGGKPYIPLIAEVGNHPIVDAFGSSVPPISFPLVQSVSLKKQMPEGVEGTEIIKTSAQSWAEKDLEALKNTGLAKFDEGVDQQGPISIAAALSKKVDEADIVKPATEANEATEAADLGAEKLDATPETRLVVFGDSDFAKNNAFRNSMDLFINSINWLAKQEDLISIRPKNDAGKPLMVSQYQANLVFYSSLVILPGAVAIFGTFICLRRRLRG